MRTHLPKFRLNREALFGMMVLAAVGVSPVHAATITVDPTAADAAVAGDAKCSLREAVLSVNAGANVGDCIAVVTDAYGTNDTIVLPAGTYTLTVSGVDEIENAATVGVLDVLNTPDATIGDLDVTKSVRIIGAGSLLTTIQWDPAIAAASRDRIFHVNATTGTVDVVVQGVKLTQGQTSQLDLGAGPASGSGPLPTNYYLRRAGGALAVGPAASVVLVDPNITGQAHSEGRGGSKKPTEHDETGATFTLTLTDVIVDGNVAGGDGGGIYTAAAMTATSTIVRNNLALTNGGGVYNEGNTSFTGSTLSGNRAEGGGGLFLTGSNTVNIAGTTLSANRAIGGGAISGRAKVTINVVNSTLSGNLGDDVGAGFYSNGPASLRFVTIANNIAGADAPTAGAGINTFPSGAVNVALKNVLLAANRKGWDPVAEPDGPAAPAALPSANCGSTGGAMSITSAGYNLSSDASCTALTQATDRNNVDPKIGPLADNGGPTQTHALAADSPALSAGAADPAVTVDQRGQPRQTPPDIGAFELANVVSGGTEPTAPIVVDGGGCTVGGEKPFDPALPAMLAAALAVLGWRRRAVK